MKHIVLLAFALISFYSQAQPKKVLFIGNSYTYVNDLPLMFRNLALANGDTITYDSSAPGGYTFQQHCTNSNTLSKISAQAWDYVILQEQSQLPSFPPTQVQTDCFPYATQLCNLILANDSCSQVVFYMTWGRKYGDAANCAFYPPLCTFEGMQNRLRESYLQMGNDNEAIVSPVGQAFKYSRMADSTINLYTSDNSHPSVAGTYLAACTFYATIFQKSPVGINFNGGLSASNAAFLQQIAYQTVFDSLSVWNINVYNAHADFSYTQNMNNPFEFQFTDNSNNAHSYWWDFGNGNTSTSANPTYTFQTPGVYTVTLTVSDGCVESSLSKEITVVATGVENIQNNSEITIVKNAEGLYLNNEKSVKNASVNIFNMLGQSVYYNSNYNNNELINISEWPKGVYIIKYTNSNIPLTGKVDIK
ncbi:MAG: T9SS type A sorting domain-containing protein [Bacteroidia bacterium]|nr:T9SS type A sorting domain-containing protein [Bacteroidia bacterium]